MSKDTITLTLNGDVPIGLFATALKHFTELIQALTEELATSNEAPIDWQVSHLASGSAITTIRGVIKQTEKKEQVLPDITKVTKAYIDVGKALQNLQPIPYSEEVAQPARALTSIINGHITSIDFTTPNDVAHIKERVTEEKLTAKQYSLGVVSGVVRAISDRPRLRLAVYDQLFDRVINCYLEPDKEDLARDVWRRNVAVTGLIYRDAETGRPIEVRDVSSVRTLDAEPVGNFKEARGVLIWQHGDEGAEVSIRRMRDG